MWKKCGSGSKRIGILLLLLVLAVGSLSAWDFGGKLFGKSKSPVENQEPTESQNLLLTELQTELDALQQIISNSQATIAKQAAELTALKASSTVYAVNHNVLKGEYDALLIAYNELVNAPTVSDYASPWGGIIGGGATYSPADGHIGAELLGGVSFKNVTWTTGVEWKPARFEFVIPKIDDLIFKTGLQYRF